MAIKSITEILIELYKSKYGRYGAHEDNMMDIIVNEGDTDSAGQLFTGDVRLELDSSPGVEQRVVLKQTKPFPLNITSLSMKGNAGD